MSQPSGLETPASDELKTKKGLGYYLKPWKWRKKPQIVTQNSTEETDGEPRRNSGKALTSEIGSYCRDLAPTTPTKNENFDLPSNRQPITTAEETKPINDVHIPPTIPKQVQKGHFSDFDVHFSDRGLRSTCRRLLAS